MKFLVAICLLVIGANSLLRKLSTVIASWNNLVVISKEKLMNELHGSRVRRLGVIFPCWWIVSCVSRLYNSTLDHCTVQDRKSTRLNSSHTVISYAVFCLKKKKKKKNNNTQQQQQTKNKY